MGCLNCLAIVAPLGGMQIYRQPGATTDVMGVDLVEQVFQASALVMADLRVLKDVAFMGVAMTAEQWVPLLQVTQRDLLPWLHNKHLQGYKCAAYPHPASMHSEQPLPGLHSVSLRLLQSSLMALPVQHFSTEA